MSDELLMQGLHLEQIGGEYVGLRDGYRFSMIKVSMGYVRLYAFVFVMQTPIEESMRKIIQKAVHTTCRIGGFKQRNDVLYVFPNIAPIQKAEVKLQKAETALTDAITTLKSFSFRTLDHCFVCGEEKSEEETVNRTFRQMYLPVHPSCAKELVQSAKQAVENEGTKTKNLPFSLLLGALGALIGLVPIFLGMLATGSVYAILYAAIPIAAMAGYKAGKAPKLAYATAIVIALSFLAMLFFEFWLWTSIASEAGLTLAGLIAEYPDTTPLILEDLGISVLFTAIGVYLSWRFISGTVDKNAKAAETIEKQ